VLAALQKKELINDADVVQILSQEHSGFHVWLGEPFKDEGSAHFVARMWKGDHYPWKNLTSNKILL